MQKFANELAGCFFRCLLFCTPWKLHSSEPKQAVAAAYLLASGRSSYQHVQQDVPVAEGVAKHLSSLLDPVKEL